MEATQESTQPCTDPRRIGLNNSGLLDEDLSDIICILHPNSRAAHDAVAATARHASWHILQKDELQYGGAVDIALRLSSKVHDYSLGFCFGRNAARCDILLAADSTSRRVSNTHFRIYLTDDGILMIEDISTNGTVVDKCHLHKKAKDRTRMLTNGSLIELLNGDKSSDEVIRFVVRIPNRDGYAEDFSHNLARYFDRAQKHRAGTVQPARRQTPAATLQWATPHGMHWSGGSMYNVTGQIGKGAFATVYKVATKQHGTVFAAKEIDKRRFMKNGILDLKVDNELKIIRDLKHPNIVQYIDHHEHDRWMYIIMEYVPGGELTAYLHAHGKIPEDMVRPIARQVLHALHYLHRRKVTHRDIKPDNILISSLDPLKVKLSDFGLSKVVQDETFLKTFCGTLLYCAPEVYPDYENYRRGVVRKRRRLGDPPPKISPYDQSVDMWSLGAVLFHILGGIPPYTGRGDDRGAQMLRTIMTTEADYNSLHEAGVSEAGIDLVSKLLNRDPQLRPKERECLKHAWLVDLPDLDEYPDEDSMSDYPDELSNIGEEMEAGLDASLLSPDEDPVIEGELAENVDSDLAQSKRPRVGSPPAEIRYPSLPNIEISKDVQPISQSTPRRLFGEITSSAVRSSHALRDGIGISEDGEFSVHDFISSTGESIISDGDSLNSVLSLPENPVAGSAPSLLGAENLVRQLNMNSWHPGTSSDPHPSAETANPQPSETAETVEAANGNAQGEMQQSSSGATPKPIKFSRRIDLPIPDTASERSTPDNNTARDTSAPRGDSSGEIFDIELANTIDAKTGQEVPEDAEMRGFRPPADPRQIGGSVGIPRQIHALRKQQRPLLGKLTTLPGSIFDLTLRLEDRMTSWGRGSQATVCYPDAMDARIPAYALEVTFWASGLEESIAGGKDWMEIPRVFAILSTKSSQCIWVNDTKLRRTPQGGSFPDDFEYGKLYTGDIITVYRNRKQFLKFRCEFYHGESARFRPAHEEGFQIHAVLKSKEKAAGRQPAQQKRDGRD